MAGRPFKSNGWLLRVKLACNVVSGQSELSFAARGMGTLKLIHLHSAVDQLRLPSYRGVEESID